MGGPIMASYSHENCEFLKRVSKSNCGEHIFKEDNLEAFDGAVINTLPNEILDYIFSFISIKERLCTELVCRRWREIGKTWSWPTKLDLHLVKVSYMKNSCVTDDIISSLLLRCGRNLKQLALSIEVSGYQLTSKALGVIGKSCPNLVEIKLGLAGLPTQDLFTNWYLINLAKGCAKLRKVSIGYSYDMDDMNVSLFLKQCHSLDYLELIENRAIKGDCFSSLNINLKCFYMYGCKRLMPTVVAEHLLNKCHRIEELGLIDCCKFPLPLLSKVVHYYNNTMKVLYLDEYAMNPEEWIEILVVLQFLEELSLCGSVGVDDNVIKALAKKCNKLRVLNISETDVTDVGVSALASMSSLRVLDVSYTHFIAGPGIQTLASQGYLEELHFRDIARDESLLEDSCISLAKCCPKFCFLDVCDNKNITNHLVEEVCSSLECGFLKGPVALHVAGTLVTDSVKGCERLKLVLQDDSLDISNETHG